MKWESLSNGCLCLWTTTHAVGFTTFLKSTQSPIGCSSPHTCNVTSIEQWRPIWGWNVFTATKFAEEEMQIVHLYLWIIKDAACYSEISGNVTELFRRKVLTFWRYCAEVDSWTGPDARCMPRLLWAIYAELTYVLVQGKLTAVLLLVLGARPSK